MDHTAADKAAAELDGLCSYLPAPKAAGAEDVSTVSDSGVPALSAPLWHKGDSVELIVSLGDGVNAPRMVLKVRAREGANGLIWHQADLPPLAHG